MGLLLVQTSVPMLRCHKQKNVRALKPSLHCNEEPYNIEFCANLGPARCDVGTFLMHAERKTVKPRETLVKQPTNTKTCNLVCSQAIICLPCQNL